MDKEIISSNNNEDPNQKNTRREFNFPKSHYLVAVLLILGVILGGNAIVKNNQLNKATNHINSIYSKSFLELADSVAEIDNCLSKGAVSHSAGYLSELSDKIYVQSYSAMNSLGQLPVNHIELDNTSKVLSQVGDYTYSLSKKISNGHEITPQEQKDLAALSKYAATLSDKLYKLEDSMFKSGMNFDSDNVQKAFANAKESTDMGGSFQSIEENFQDYPSLIYDGPFSDHIARMEALHTKGKNEITKVQAEEKIREFIPKDKIKKISYSGSSNTTIDTYKYIVTDHMNTRTSIEISKQGGFVVFMLKNRDVNDKKLDVKDAIIKGGEYLTKAGIHSMTESYYEIKDNVITVNYAYKENGITMYPDLIKLKIAMDDGEMLGFESQGYLMSHTVDRNLNPVNLTIEEAKDKVSSAVEIMSMNMAVIPKTGGKEVLCYEFVTKLNDKKFIIYINATTGEEEQILMLMESKNGVLTV